MFLVARSFARTAGVCLVLSTLILSGCGTNADPMPDDEQAPSALPVDVATVERGTATAQLTSTATLEAEEEATVVARVSGVVERVLVEEGQYVKKGQSLAELDDERLALEVERAKGTLERLRRDFDRIQTMHEKQLVSQQQYDEAKSEYQSQEVATDLAQLNLQYTTIRAPIAGWVSLRHIKPGNMVRENDPAFQITNLNSLRATLHVPERELSKVRLDQSATLTFDALAGRSFAGRVALISPTVDPSTGTFRVTVQVHDASRSIKPGMFGRVHVQYDEHEDALLAPKSAVVEEDDEVSVFTARDSIARQQSVTTGYSSGDRIEILSGLSEGEQVVLSGQSALRDSARVKIIRQ